jgi:hypothetical protein
VPSSQPAIQHTFRCRAWLLNIGPSDSEGRKRAHPEI